MDDVRMRQREVQSREEREHETQEDRDAAESRRRLGVHAAIAVGFVEDTDAERHAPHERRDHGACDRGEHKRYRAQPTEIHVTGQRLDARRRVVDDGRPEMWWTWSRVGPARRAGRGKRRLPYYKGSRGRSG